MMDRCDQEARLKSTTRLGTEENPGGGRGDSSAPGYAGRYAKARRGAYSQRSKRKTTGALRVGTRALSGALFNY